MNIVPDLAVLDAIWAAYAQLARKHGEPVKYRVCRGHRILVAEQVCGYCLRPTDPVPFVEPSAAAGGKP